MTNGKALTGTLPLLKNVNPPQLSSYQPKMFLLLSFCNSFKIHQVLLAAGGGGGACYVPPLLIRKRLDLAKICSLTLAPAVFTGLQAIKRYRFTYWVVGHTSSHH